MAIELKTAPRWVILLVVVGLTGLAGVGVYSQVPKLGTDAPTPAPAPSPTPTPLPPNIILTPADVWRPLAPPGKNAVTGLELPAPMEMSSSRHYIVVAAKCKGPVRWLLSAKSGQAMDALESPITNSVMIFPGTVEDVITVLAYTGDKTGPSDMAVTFIQVKNDGPPVPPVPGPGPGPNPPPAPAPAPVPNAKPDKVKAMHVTFYLDFSKQTAATAAITNDSALRAWITARGCEIHELSIKADLDQFGLADALKGKYPPLMILQSKDDPQFKDGELVEVLPLTSVQQVKDDITRHTK